MDEIRTTIEREIYETELRTDYAADWIFGENTTNAVNAYIKSYESGLTDISNKTFWLKAHFAIDDAQNALDDGDLCKSITRLNDANYFLGCAEHYQQNTDTAREKQKKSKSKAHQLKNDCLQWLSENHNDETLKWRKAELIHNHLKENGINKKESTISKHWL